MQPPNASSTGSVAPNSQKLLAVRKTGRRVAILLAVVATLFGGVILLVIMGMRAFDPPDRVKVRLSGLPSDAQYWCLVADERGRISTVTWYDPADGPGSWYERPPRGDEWYGKPGAAPPDGVVPSIKYSHFDRLGVLWKDGAGKWKWCWLPGVAPERRDASWLFGNGWLPVEIPKEAEVEEVPKEKRASLSLVD